MWYVYMLKCSDNSLYTGITNDLERRINDHNNKKASKYTRTRTPVTLIYKEECSNRSDALKRETRIKQLSRKEKMQLIKT